MSAEKCWPDFLNTKRCDKHHDKTWRFNSNYNVRVRLVALQNIQTRNQRDWESQTHALENYRQQRCRFQLWFQWWGIVAWECFDGSMNKINVHLLFLTSSQYSALENCLVFYNDNDNSMQGRPALELWRVLKTLRLKKCFFCCCTPTEPNPLPEERHKTNFTGK